MKTIDIFCASQAAITTMDPDTHHQSSDSGSCRAIDRHNPIIQDQKRLTKTFIPTPTLAFSTLKKINPSSTTLIHHHHINNKKKSKAQKTSGFSDENKDQHQVISNKKANANANNNNSGVRRQGGVLLGWGCTRPGDFISPANSSRFLLTDKALSDDQFDPLLEQVSPPPPPPVLLEEKVYKSDSEKSYKKDDGILSSSPVKTSPRSTSSLSSRSSVQQEVVLKVSLHCRGCERKMRKHISKMEGVTSFNIDFIAKKVTVVGDITPLAVLTSVSKVKNAKLLTPTTISSPNAPLVDSNFSGIKKQFGIVA